MSPPSSVPTIVIDNGSYKLRAGHPNDITPQVSVPSLVGQPLNRGVAMGTGVREYRIGYDAQQKRGMLSTTHPVGNGGIVTDWDALEKLWAHVIFRDLRIIPEDYCFSITVPPNDKSKEQKEMTLELMMETFNANSIYLGVSSVFALYSYGKTTGLALDIGLHSSNVVPVHEGYSLIRQVMSSEVAGECLSLYLSRLLRAQGYGFSTSKEMDLVNMVKEKLCYVDLKYDGRNNNNNNDNNNNNNFPHSHSTGPEKFYLPDGQPIPINSERHQCPEALFNFSLIGQEHIPKHKVLCDNDEEYIPSIYKGISWLTHASIAATEPSLRGILLNNIILCGGSSLFSGMRDRIHSELILFNKEMRPSEAAVGVSVAELGCREYCAWLGGCMLSSIGTFQQLTVSRSEYEEQGRRVIHCKNL